MVYLHFALDWEREEKPGVAGRLLGRLDEKISVHNGLDRFQQESFYSVWHDLKELVLLSR